MMVRHVMKKVVHTLPPSATIVDAARVMRSNNVGFLPVCDDERPVGVITDRDLVVRGLADAYDADTPVAELMTVGPLVMLNERADLEAAEELMMNARVARLLVVDDDERLVGVLSLSDIVDYEEEQRAFRTFRAVTHRDDMP